MKVVKGWTAIMVSIILWPPPKKPSSKSKFNFKWKLFGHRKKNKGISKTANLLKFFGVPYRTPSVLRKTYPSDIIREIVHLPICGYIKVGDCCLTWQTTSNMLLTTSWSQQPSFLTKYTWFELVIISAPFSRYKNLFPYFLIVGAAVWTGEEEATNLVVP